mmetsp:Transcript_12397/g.32793  ORF Transcript_12397/g.32793 Transcript_12397/m.32793 type:complete len:632 (-) Transcript_12397:1161-3056(-)
MVVTHQVSGDQLYIGVDVPACPDLNAALREADAAGCDFILTPIVHPRYERPLNPDAPPRDDPLTRSDNLLSSSEWMASIIGKLSPGMNFDSPQPAQRARAAKALAEEVSLASHLSLRAAVLPAPSSIRPVANYANALLNAMNYSSGTQVWVTIPIGTVETTGAKLEKAVTDSWETWNTIRNLVDSHPNIAVALEVGPHVPPRDMLDRWLAEPVRLVILTTSAFVKNQKGYPVLSKNHQALLKMLFTYRPYFVLSGRSQTGSAKTANEGLKQYIQYLGHLFGKQNPPTEADRFEAPYHDYLQTPLQPLSDNLESQTYETFEQDPIKYKMYGDAITAYMSGSKVGVSEAVVCFVLGAGRGPLVKAALAAAETKGKRIKVYAIEKNPHALLSLRGAKAAAGLAWDDVTIVGTDMREWSADVKADLIVSELLGSFGDNELSPECLNSACARLLKENGTCIPKSYTSYLVPISSSKLREELGLLRGNRLANHETPYVVAMQRMYRIDDPQACFTFDHAPMAKEPSLAENERFATLQFKTKCATVIHGLAGYFECKLFRELSISTNPLTKSEGMFSWFPIFFPLRHPLAVRPGDTVEVNIWRKVSESKVWYEWCLTAPIVSRLHNPAGRSYSMSLNS